MWITGNFTWVARGVAKNGEHDYGSEVLKSYDEMYFLHEGNVTFAVALLSLEIFKM